jgi:hypothetical protein
MFWIASLHDSDNSRISYLNTGRTIYEEFIVDTDNPQYNDSIHKNFMDTGYCASWQIFFENEEFLPVIPLD